MTSYPANFIPIEKAFEEAVAKLEPDARTVATDEVLSNVDEDEADRIYQSINEAERRVEKRFRNALADGPLVPWVKSGGQMEILSDREAWRPEALGIPGFEPATHHLTNPGPNDDREVFIEQKVLKGWLDGFGAAPRHGGDPPEAPEIEAEPAGPMVAPMRNLQVEISEVKALVEKLIVEKEPKATATLSPSTVAPDPPEAMGPLPAPSIVHVSRPRGPKPLKLAEVVEAMRHDIAAGVDLSKMLEKQMEAKYDASRDTCRKARIIALTPPSTNSDKQSANDK